MRHRVVNAKVRLFPNGFEAMAIESGVSVNGHASASSATRALAVALSFKPGQFDVRCLGETVGDAGTHWQIKETVR